MLVSVLGFGGSEIGYERAGARTVARLLGTALDAGLNVIDTAECYEDSEALIGAALRSRRSEVYLLTKCGHPRGYGRGDWRAGSLLSSIERSLERLRTDRLDLIQLHSCELSDLRKGEAITALERARERGWTRYIGYSGDGEAARFAVECGRFDTLQTSVSIADQEALDLALPREARLVRAHDRVQVRRVGRVGQRDAELGGAALQRAQQVAHASLAAAPDDVVERLDPLLVLERVDLALTRVGHRFRHVKSTSLDHKALGISTILAGCSEEPPPR